MQTFKSFLNESLDKNTEKQIKRLEDLAAMLGKNAHRWSLDPSKRMMGWVDEYDDIKSDHPEVFKAYCQKNKLDRSHTGTDLLA